MTMFNITDGNNNVSRDKPVEHIDMVIGLHVSACTSCTRTMRVRRDIAIDITESVQLLVRFNALRSMPVMPKLEHYNQNAMRSMAAAALATHPVSRFAPARTNSRALSDNSRLIVSDAVEVPVDLRSSFSKLISPAMYKAELRRHVEHVRWYLEHPTEARALSQSRTTSSARSGHASSTTTCSNSGILHQRSG